MDKMSKYLELTNRLDQIKRDYNPCDFKGDKCKLSNSIFKNCCRSCPNNKNGCIINSLGCKLYFCGPALNSLPENVRREIDTIREEAVLNNFNILIGTDEEIKR